MLLGAPAKVGVVAPLVAPAKLAVVALLVHQRKVAVAALCASAKVGCGCVSCAGVSWALKVAALALLVLEQFLLLGRHLEPPAASGA